MLELRTITAREEESGRKGEMEGLKEKRGKREGRKERGGPTKRITQEIPKLAQRHQHQPNPPQLARQE